MAYLVANRSEGKLNFKKLQQSCITSLLTVLNFIKNLLTAKSKELTSDFEKKKHSRPYSKIGMHLHLVQLTLLRKQIDRFSQKSRLWLYKKNASHN